MTSPAEARTRSLRRVVTGLNASGRSHVAYEGGPDPVLEFSPGDGLYEIWSDPDGAGQDRAALLPAPGGAKCRWFTVLPGPPGVEPSTLLPFYDATFEAMGGRHVRPDTSRHPGMHLTPTLDFIVVIEGRVRLILDTDERELGPGDVVVQRATNHAWACVGETPALLAAILIDKPPEAGQ